MCLCSFLARVSWLHGLIDTYTEPNPDKAEAHLPIRMKSDVHCMHVYMDKMRCGNEELHPFSMKYFKYVGVGFKYLKLLLCCLVLILTGLQCVSGAPR